MKIGTRDVGPGAPVFVIAECGSNHGGSLDAALALIDAAADAGADAAKFQAFSVDRFIMPREHPEELRKYELPPRWLPTLKAKCEERGIEFLCTAFDIESLDTIDPYVNAHKVGSYEVNSLDYLEAVVDTGKPWMASLGKARIIPAASILLRCISRYPAQVDGYLRGAPYAWWGFVGGDHWSNALWGVSDHTLDPLTVPAAAVALGACVVEKHMKNGNVEGNFPDWPVSVRHQEFGEMVRAIRNTEKAVRG